MCLFSVVLGQLQLEPLSATVLRGSDVHFNATVTGKWQIMTWTVRGFLVLTVNSTAPITPSEQFSARFCRPLDSRCVEFTIHNVSRNDTGPVICAVQGDYGSKAAQLIVQGTIIKLFYSVLIYTQGGIVFGRCFCDL